MDVCMGMGMGMGMGVGVERGLGWLNMRRCSEQTHSIALHHVSRGGNLSHLHHLVGRQDDRAIHVVVVLVHDGLPQVPVDAVQGRSIDDPTEDPDGVRSEQSNLSVIHVFYQRRGYNEKIAGVCLLGDLLQEQVD